VKKGLSIIFINIVFLSGILFTGCPNPGRGPGGINEIYVANEKDGSVTVYSRTADGDTAPLRTIMGIDTPHDVAVDIAHNEIFVACGGGAGFVNVYDRSTCAFERTLSGLSSPTGIALDPVHDEIFVLNVVGINVYDRTAEDDDPPNRTISGENPGLSIPTGIAVDTAHDEIFVVDSGNACVLVFNRDDSGNIFPKRTITGEATTLSWPYGIALDAAENEIFVCGWSNITVFDMNDSGNIAPKRTITGDLTNHIFGASLDTVNNELFVVFDSIAAVNTYPKSTSTTTGAYSRRLTGDATGLNQPRGICVVTQ
jgi:DNA-binding beta-propeller fold protein YncE